MKKSRVSLMVFIISSLVYAKERGFTLRELELLKKGKIVKRPLTSKLIREKKLIGGTSFLIINKDARLIMATIQSYRKHPQIFPRTLEVRLVSRLNNKDLVFVKQGNKWINISYYVLYTYHPREFKISWRLYHRRPHDLDDTWGYWQFIPQPNGSTLVVYACVIDIGGGIIHYLFGERIRKGILDVPLSLKQWIENK
jgi:hypothetical protein